MSDLSQDYTPFLPYLKPVIEREAARVARQVRRAQRKRLPATLTLEAWLRTLARYEWRCAYCRKQFETLDHLEPIKDGGGTTAENCVPACERCNMERARFAQRVEQIGAELAVC